MTNQTAHDAVAWAKQRLDDLDVTITEVEKAVDELKGQAREAADASLARLNASRHKLQEYAEQLRSEAATVRSGIDESQKALEDEWVEVESAVQSFLIAAEERADIVRDFVIARAQAQRQAWEASFNDLRQQAEAVVDKANDELDAAIDRLSDQAEKFQARIGDAKDAGDESWAAVKQGLTDARAVHDRTIKKIREAFSKLL